MARRWTLWLACACAPALAACSFLLGEGFTDPNADAEKEDAGGTTPDANSGGVDGSKPEPDAASGTDGSAQDADGDARSDGGCPAATVSFCDDFERAASSAVKGAWDVVDLNAGGALTIKTEGNGNRILAASVSAKGGQATLSKTFTQQPSKFHLELTLTVSTLASTGAVYIGGIAMPNGGGSPSLVYLFVDDKNLWFVQQVTDGISYFSQILPITVGVASRISIDVTFNGKLKVLIDGAPSFEDATKTFLLPKPPQLYIGASSIDGTGDDGAFFIDDLVFTID